MANTLTNLVPSLYAALDQVSREQVGFIPAVTINPQVNRVAVGQTVYVPIAPASTAADVTPAVTPPDTGDQTIGNVTIAISKSRRVSIRWNGEEEAGVESGVGWRNILEAQFAQAMRTLTNEMEADIAALYKKASRAYGTAGTAPFGTAGDYTDASYVREILAANGAPISDLQLVLSTVAGANLRGKQAQVQMAGNDTLQRQGVLLDYFGMQIRESGQVAAHTKGTAANYAVDLVAGYDVGTTTVHVDTGTGTMVAGDILTNTQSGRDATKYVVTTGHAGDGDQDVVIGAPGLKVAWVNNDTVAVGNNYTANLAFSRSAIVLATRAPLLPTGGDLAVDSMMLTDPRSGLSFEVRMYPQYRQMGYEVAIAWGVACIKPAHVAILLG